MTVQCPICGSLYTPTIEETISRIQFSVLQQRIVYTLADRFGSFVHTDVIIDGMYWDDPNGGPDTAANCMRCHILQARKKLRKVGLEIESSGRKHNSYRLVWQSPKEEK